MAPRDSNPAGDTGIPVVLVHGNPETPAVWAPVVERLGRPSVHTPNLPGFGCPLPAGFDATKEAYVGWLVAEIERLGRPVHLVGHDWGGALTIRVAETRPDLLVSWCSDSVGLVNPAYVWHDLAQVWQTPGEGEENVAGMAAIDPDTAVAVFGPLGIPEAQARAFSEAFDDRMGAAVLALYRSALPELMAPWIAEAADARARPGLAVLATDDPYLGDLTIGEDAAATTGAEVALVDGLGHWWMLQDPDRAARLLQDWFARHDG